MFFPNFENVEAADEKSEKQKKILIQINLICFCQLFVSEKGSRDLNKLKIKRKS